jgi:hypothetical protein
MFGNSERKVESKKWCKLEDQSSTTVHADSNQNIAGDKMKPCKCGRHPNKEWSYSNITGAYTWEISCLCGKRIAITKYAFNRASEELEDAWNEDYCNKEPGSKWNEEATND